MRKMSIENNQTSRPNNARVVECGTNHHFKNEKVLTRIIVAGLKAHVEIHSPPQLTRLQRPQWNLKSMLLHNSQPSHSSTTPHSYNFHVHTMINHRHAQCNIDHLPNRESADPRYQHQRAPHTPNETFTGHHSVFIAKSRTRPVISFGRRPTSQRLELALHISVRLSARGVPRLPIAVSNLSL